MLELPSVLNEGQETAAKGFFKFLLGEDKELIISGPGGVGKTFLMSYLIDKIIPQYQDMCQLMGIPVIYTNVAMTATTNKAAEVLAIATERPTETIYKYLNLIVQDDFSTGESHIKKNSAWGIKYNTVIFVDESSMIDTPLLNHIRESTHNCKIVYVGDHCQLAPIKEKISPVYKKDFPFFHLTEPVRNKGNPVLQAICAQLRTNVETLDFLPIQTSPGIIDHFANSEMESYLNTHFINQNSNERILAYTNSKVETYNNYIRGIRNLPDTFQVGELLVNNAANKYGLSVEQEVEVVHKSAETEERLITDDVFLTVRLYTLRSKYTTYTGVAVPENKQHFLDLLQWTKKAKKWAVYFHLKNFYPDLRQRDAATTHKAQGSTYDTVLIDLQDLSKCNRQDVTARLLYVAFTRARSRVILYGELASKYGTVI